MESHQQTVAPRSGSQKSYAPDPRGRPWSLQDALPDRSSALGGNKPDVAIAPGPGLGRVPLQSGAGSFGLETETRVKPDLLPDGHPIPGLQSTARERPSYFGLSLSVPTSGKTIFPPGLP